MQHLSYHRGSGSVILVVIGVAAVLVTAVVVSVVCVARYGGEQEHFATESNVKATSQANQAANMSAAHAFDASLACSAVRKISPGPNDRLEKYFTDYLLCVEPALAGNTQQLRNRLNYLNAKFREEFPMDNPDALPPGSSFRINGDPGKESMDDRNTGLISAVP